MWNEVFQCENKFYFTFLKIERFMHSIVQELDLINNLSKTFFNRKIGNNGKIDFVDYHFLHQKY